MTPALRLAPLFGLALCAAVRADDGGDALRPPSLAPAIELGLEVRGARVWHLQREVARPGQGSQLGPRAFARYGWLEAGAGMDFEVPVHGSPGAHVSLDRYDGAFYGTLGASLPGTLAGDGWFAHRLRLGLLVEVGAARTHVDEDLDAGGFGNRSSTTVTPFVGCRLGLRGRLGRRVGGLGGVGLFYRHALVAHHVNTAAGRALALGDTAGLIVFGGADWFARP